MSVCRWHQCAGEPTAGGPFEGSRGSGRNGRTACRASVGDPAHLFRCAYSFALVLGTVKLNTQRSRTRVTISSGGLTESRNSPGFCCIMIGVLNKLVLAFMPFWYIHVTPTPCQWSSSPSCTCFRNSVAMITDQNPYTQSRHHQTSVDRML